MSPTEERAAANLLLRVGRAFLRRYEDTFHGARAREYLWEAQEGHCLYCGGLMLSRYRYPEHPDSDTCDHVWPRASGGPDSPGNFALMHRKCNSNKGRRLPTAEEMERLRVTNSKLGWPTPNLIRVWPVEN